MWVVYTIIAYFLLAIAMPLGIALGAVWRRARVSRQVTCPVLGGPALVALDGFYAVRMHAAGNSEARVKDCGLWPERRNCRRECLAQIGAAI